MFLSIVIPIYNDEKFLNECLDSCLDQELSKDEYEIICVDDGSTDRTREILKEYEDKYPNLRVVLREHGKGGRTVGFGYAQGDYIWFVDHDDLIAPRALDELKRVTEENPDFDRYTFPFYQFNDALTDEEYQLFQSGALKSTSIPAQNQVYVWNSIFRFSFLKEKKIYPRSSQLDEAGAFWEMPAPFRIFGGDTAMINECIEKGVRTMLLQGRPLYHYRIHAGQTISDNNPKKVAERAELRRNRVLYLGHRVWIQKQRYIALREQDPAAAADVLTDIIGRLHYIASYSSGYIEEHYWKEILNRFREKDIMFRRKPKDLKQSLWERLKQLSIKEKLHPKWVLVVIAYHYSFTYVGAKLLYCLEWRKREREKERIQRLRS